MTEVPHVDSVLMKHIAKAFGIDWEEDHIVENGDNLDNDLILQEIACNRYVLYVVIGLAHLLMWVAEMLQAVSR